ncbi:DNA binding domain-containing protein, excisionase family [Nocardioides scoriae]|uniref:DNA binding domain-containing protein, excisionase family n=1 Tax=Nocardioides scoriae TaxID=642780 RepID=A0A1H1VG20_9ACTN|nr:helix-turn-helix domain-containing protein [Nocardioides scoriae]SDS83692.1 DNA binding domain-containing protein, excisionase family [Nocardioides scoriae]
MIEESKRETGGVRRVRARMLTLDDVAEELAISRAQVYALVRRGDLRAGKIGGGGGQWRVDRTHLEAYLERTWADTAAWVQARPLTDGEEPPATESGRVKIVLTPADRAKALRAAVRDDSKVRVSLTGTRRVGPSPEVRGTN